MTGAAAPPRHVLANSHSLTAAMGGCAGATTARTASKSALTATYSRFMTITVRAAGSLPAVSVIVCPS